jgi:hypothetical protein
MWPKLPLFLPGEAAVPGQGCQEGKAGSHSHWPGASLDGKAEGRLELLGPLT